VKRWVGIIGVLALLFPVGLAARGSSEDATRRCTTAQLKVRLINPGAAGGTAGAYIAFTNRASAPCRLTGWPTLVAIAMGKTTTAVRRRSTMFGPRPTIKGMPVVTLGHGRRADAVLTVGDNPGPGQTACPPPYRRLRVTPPGNSRSVLLSAWLSGFGHFLPSCTAIEISFVVPSSDLYHG
jgi:hypothetical protein